MNDSVPGVSIVVPCRNEKVHIETCLRSILAQEVPAGGFEVIVADGMSDDGTRDIVERLAASDQRIRIVDNPLQIVSAALNEGIRAARGEVIIRMDAHTTYAPDYIRRCVEILHETGADNVGGPWMAKGKSLVGRAIAAAFESPFALGGSRGHDPNYEGLVDTVYLGCWPRQLFNRFGLFDEELIRNQDDEFNLRLARAGGKIWQSPRIRSHYRPRESLRSLFQQYLQYGYWKVRVIQKHTKPASIRHILPVSFILLLFLSFALWPWWALAGRTFLGSIGFYLAANAAASLLTALRNRWDMFLVLPLVFGCYHFGYGVGFLQGIWDFMILKRGPSPFYTGLTRPVSPPQPRAMI